jgi:hypothetical protein
MKERNIEMMPSQFVIPEAILIGNPVCKLLKSWIPDKDIRG